MDNCIKKLLNDYDFTYAWETVNTLYHSQLISLFKQRVVDSFLQSWYTDMERNSVLSVLYKHVKFNFEIEFCLKNIVLGTEHKSCINNVKSVISCFKD